jgi:heptaprenyl diphosphate synthase
MQERAISRSCLLLAFLTATACSVYIVENLLLRALPLPFIRIGLANVVVLYLLLNNQPGSALLVSILKSLIGGVFTFTMLSPGTVLSLSGALISLGVMSLLIKFNPGFSIIGISIAGALSHNIVQIGLVRLFIIQTDSVFGILPVLLVLGLISGYIVAYITKLFMVHLNNAILQWERS